MADLSDWITTGYIELIRHETDGNPYLRDENALYPVIPTNKNFNGPYLTPRRHLEYCTFWGLTSGIGLASIVYTLLRFK